MKKFAAMTAAVVAFGVIMTGCGSSDKAAEPAKTETPAATTPAADTTKPADTAKPADNTASTGAEQVVHVKGTKDFKWVLDKTEVKKGQPVKLIVEAEQGMHGITVEGTPINNEHVMTGKTTEVTFTPDKAGDLNIVCSLMCGTGHAQMKNTLKVVE